MIRLRKPNQDKEFFRIDLAPMINIVFLLLIFFLLTSTAIKQGNAINLPHAKMSKNNHKKNIVISLNKGNQLQLNREDISITTLSDKLSRELHKRDNKIVTIESDKEIVFEQVGEILEITRKAGAVDFILATEPLE